jgi:hypothetical protein
VTIRLIVIRDEPRAREILAAVARGLGLDRLEPDARGDVFVALEASADGDPWERVRAALDADWWDYVHLPSHAAARAAAPDAQAETI